MASQKIVLKTGEEVMTSSPCISNGWLDLR